jgi:glycosyltransferase involved in cell wall biosynthesis
LCLLLDEGLRSSMGLAGRVRVLEMFSWEEAARKTLEVYREVM